MTWFSIVVVGGVFVGACELFIVDALVVGVKMHGGLMVRNSQSPSGRKGGQNPCAWTDCLYNTGNLIGEDPRWLKTKGFM
jgi:hypothetical protein